MISILIVDDQCLTSHEPGSHLNTDRGRANTCQSLSVGALVLKMVLLRA
jgi:hypothetical protein